MDTISVEIIFMGTTFMGNTLVGTTFVGTIFMGTIFLRTFQCKKCHGLLHTVHVRHNNRQCENVRHIGLPVWQRSPSKPLLQSQMYIPTASTQTEFSGQGWLLQNCSTTTEHGEYRPDLPSYDGSNQVDLRARQEYDNQDAWWRAMGWQIHTHHACQYYKLQSNLVNFSRLRARLCPISFAPCPFPNLAGTLAPGCGRYVRLQCSLSAARM